MHLRVFENLGSGRIGMLMFLGNQVRLRRIDIITKLWAMGGEGIPPITKFPDSHRSGIVSIPRLNGRVVRIDPLDEWKYKARA